MLKNISHQSLLVVDTPRNVNVITDTFSRLSRKDVLSALVGKKVAQIVSNSESNNEIESLGSSLTDDKKILAYLLNLPCLRLYQEQEEKTHKRENRKGRKKKGEKKREKKIPNSVCEECFTLKNIWGHLANTKYMGTLCQYNYGDRLPMKNTWGPFSNIVYINIYTQKITIMHGMRTRVHSTLYI
jgi:hypothetical protein